MSISQGRPRQSLESMVTSMTPDSPIPYTEYFLYTRQRPDRASIKEEWLRMAIEAPLKVAVQSDGRIRRWVKIPGEEKYLRVILLEDGRTVHNAFFDRGFKEDENGD